MSSLTGNDEVLTKQDLQNYHERIFPYLNGVTCIDNTFDVSNLYSTDEKMIGQWIDGKPLYQKVLTGTMPSNTTSDTEVARLSANGSEVVRRFEAFGSNTDGGVSDIITFNHVYGNSNIILYVHNNKAFNVVKNSANLYNGMSLIIIAQYTKSTDSAMQVPFGSVNDYSLTERVVGTWIDGKPLYQKTINFVFGSSGVDKTIDTISNLDEVCLICGRAVANNNDIKVSISWFYSDSDFCAVFFSGNNLIARTIGAAYPGQSGIVTIQYTKTTD